MRTSVLSTSLVVALVGIACSDDTTAPATGFHATVNSAQEVPATSVPSPGKATATFRIAGGDSLIYTLTITNAGLTNYTLAHIHAGTNTGGATNAGTGGGIVRVNLCGAGAAPACPTGTGTVSDTIVYAAGDTVLNNGGVAGHMTFEGLVAALRGFGAYVNIHTTGNTAGEIRGQIVPENP